MASLANPVSLKTEPPLNLFKFLVKSQEQKNGS